MHLCWENGWLRRRLCIAGFVDGELVRGMNGVSVCFVEGDAVGGIDGDLVGGNDGYRKLANWVGRRWVTTGFDSIFN